MTIRTLHLTTSRRSFLDQQVATLRSRGIECTILNVPGAYSAGDPRTPVDYLKYYPQVLGHGLDEYDLVHANHGLTVPFALGQPTRPIVVTFWGSDLMGDHGVVTRLGKHGAKLADEVILPSRAMAGQLDTPFRHVPFPVDTDLFEPVDRTTARATVGWDTEEPIVLFPYDPDRPEKDYARAQRLVENARIDAELKTVTGAPYEQMPAYLNASDVVLVTSRRESGPMVVKEAAACNVPVVSTDVGFVSETLSGVKRSTVSDSNQELVGALEELLTERTRSDAREQVADLDPSTFGARLEQVYEQALGGTEASR